MAQRVLDIYKGSMIEILKWKLYWYYVGEHIEQVLDIFLVFCWERGHRRDDSYIVKDYPGYRM